MHGGLARIRTINSLGKLWLAGAMLSSRPQRIRGAAERRSACMQNAFQF